MSVDFDPDILKKGIVLQLFQTCETVYQNADVLVLQACFLRASSSPELLWWWSNSSDLRLCGLWESRLHTSLHFKRNDLTQTRQTISKSRISQTKISMDCPYTIVVVVTGRMDLRPDHVFTKRLGRNRHYHGSRVADSASCLVCCFVHDGGVRYAQHWRLDLNIAD